MHVAGAKWNGFDGITSSHRVSCALFEFNSIVMSCVVADIETVETMLAHYSRVLNIFAKNLYRYEVDRPITVLSSIQKSILYDTMNINIVLTYIRNIE